MTFTVLLDHWRPTLTCVPLHAWRCLTQVPRLAIASAQLRAIQTGQLCPLHPVLCPRGYKPLGGTNYNSKNCCFLLALSGERTGEARPGRMGECISPLGFCLQSHPFSCKWHNSTCLCCWIKLLSVFTWRSLYHLLIDTQAASIT